MGYFATLAEAQRWLQLMRRRYPAAVASAAPVALLRQRDSGVPTLSSAGRAPPPVSTTLHPGRSEDNSLTDTQVIRILETRRTAAVTDDGTTEKSSGAISLLRPEDTDTRRVLKEAVINGAPVSFAVQLHCSGEPIGLNEVPSLSIFRAYKLYVTEARRDGRSCYCLRLGFFSDAISAKQVAYYVHSSFKSAAVVPVRAEECARANETSINPSALADPSRQSIDQVLDADRPRTNPAPHVTPTSAPHHGSANPPPGVAAVRQKETLEETMELLAANEIWTDSESFSETGVRHLKVDVQRRK